MLHLVLLAITNPDFSDLILHTKSVTFGLVVEWRGVYVRLFQKLIVHGGVLGWIVNWRKQQVVLQKFPP